MLHALSSPAGPPGRDQEGVGLRMHATGLQCTGGGHAWQGVGLGGAPAQLVRDGLCPHPPPNYRYSDSPGTHTLTKQESVRGRSAHS